MKTASRSLIIIVMLLLFACGARAQQSDASKIEIGAQFSSLSLRSVERSFGGVVLAIGEGQTEFHDTQTEPGFGGRFTYNLTEHFALEAEGNFFPHEHMIINQGRGGGRLLQGQFGAKLGKRWNSFGLFGKARPGIVSFSQTFVVDSLRFGDLERRTHFSFDLGGVLEFYPSRRLVARFDAGDTIIRYGSSSLFIPNLFPRDALFRTPAATRHNFQFTAGVGFRF
ncbi:MAG TPA: outer membrane beta-barrel protein [Pyrinomonadaceae bacterium]